MSLPTLYAEAWMQPRQSMRRILSFDLKERDRIMMVAITGVLFAIPFVLAFRSIEMPLGPEGEVIPRPSSALIAFIVVSLVLVSYYVTAALIKMIGTLFGGTASYNDSKTASAWTQFVVGLANLALMMLSFILPDFLRDAVRLAFTVAALYVSSAYVAEAHGFSSIAKVVAVSVAVTLLCVLFLLSLMPAGSFLPA